LIQPLLKWVGNKRRVADQIISYFPQEFNNYYEPFVGSGAVLIKLQEKKYSSSLVNFNESFASDNDSYLIDIFNYTKNNPQTIIDYYKKNIDHYLDDKRKNYEIIKDRFNHSPNGLDLCLLSRTCYGGIIRFRKSDGYMSTPVGPHKPIKPDTFKNRVIQWHNLIQDVTFQTLDFKKAINHASEGDVVYCDPPYTHSQSILYGSQSFNINELWQSIRDAKSRGVKVLLSLNGSRESHKKNISVNPPMGLFENIIDVDNGISMVDRLQKSGQKMNNSKVFDKLMMTF